jgi:type II secretory pathway pseudopilin PulG
MRPRRWRDDRGESLVELLFAIAIMSTAVVALVAGLATAIVISDMHRKQASAGAQVRAFAEAVERAVNNSSSAYVDCGTNPVPVYEAVFTAEPGYTRNVAAVRYWSPITNTGDPRYPGFFDSSCTNAGVQRVTVRVASNDNRASEMIDLIIRKPCRAGDPPCS